MKTHRLLIVPLMTVAGLTACSGSDPAVDQASLAPMTYQEPSTPASPQVDAVPAEQHLSGQLAEIDMNAKTFVIKDTQGNAQSFMFSETTKLTGGGGAKDLSGQEGHNATVRYVEMNNLKSAVQIHVEIGS
jgi:hypothetical protein